jgi:hypothetical protein
LLLLAGKLRGSACATLIYFAVNPKLVVRSRRQLDAGLYAVGALQKMLPELKARRAQRRVATDVGPSLDSAIVLVLFEYRRRLAVDNVTQVDQRPAIGALLVEAFLFGLCPKTLERFCRAIGCALSGLRRLCQLSSRTRSR